MTSWKRLFGLRPPRPEWYSPQGHHGRSRGDAIELTYLGTAGFVIRGAARTLVLDPYLSRPSPWTTLTGRLIPDEPTLRRLLPHVDDVLVGHAHHDHVLDAPALCRQTGARLIGSRAVAMVGRAAGLPERQIVESEGHEDIASGAWTVRGLPSRHGKVFGRVPLPGDIAAPPPWPPRLRDLRQGQVLNWRVDTGQLRLLHVDSADFIPAELAGTRADILCLCAVGRQSRPDYVAEIVSLVKPRWVIPCHWDTMFTRIEATPDLIPGVDLPGFIDEIRAAGAQPLLMPILGKQTFC